MQSFLSKIRNEGLSGFQLSQEDQIDAANALRKHGNMRLL